MTEEVKARAIRMLHSVQTQNGLLPMVFVVGEKLYFTKHAAYLQLKEDEASGVESVMEHVSALEAFPHCHSYDELREHGVDTGFNTNGKVSNQERIEMNNYLVKNKKQVKK